MKDKIVYMLVLLLFTACSHSFQSINGEQIQLCEYEPGSSSGLFLNLTTAKSNYKFAEPIDFHLFANLKREDDCIAFGHCRLSIQLSNSSLDIENQYRDIIFNSDLCESYVEEFKQIYSKNSENITLIWNQENCLKNKNNVEPGDYLAKISCSYEDRHGSSWEGIYHGSIRGNTEFRIE